MGRSKSSERYTFGYLVIKPTDRLRGTNL